ncbi:MAG: (2Fe-2S)-binding protein [Bacteroidia bacterium]
METYTLNINGQDYKVTTLPDTPLLWVLRDEIGLTGTKFSCGVGQCGACTVHIDGKAMRSCLMPIGNLKNVSVVTIEGLSENNDHPVQKAWQEEDVAQCGYCQAGQIMTAASFLNDNPKPNKSEIKNAMHGNICRCATYNRIEKAVEKAANNL